MMLRRVQKYDRGMKDVCVFCQDPPEKWAEEHITPRWLLDHLEISAQDQMFQGVAAADAVEQRRVHATRRFVEGRVCEACNTGWMSRLETSAKPIVTELINAKRVITALTADESGVVAKWMAKTAFLLANASLGKRPVPPEHRKLLHGDKVTIPSGVGIFGMHAPFDRQASYLQSARWPQILGPESRGKVTASQGSYKIGLQYRYFYFVVVYYGATSPYEYAIAAGHHVPMWPQKMVWPAYVSREPLQDRTSLPLLKEFADAVAVLTP